MAMQTPQDLFLHELSDIHQAEQLILKALPKMAKDAQDPQAKQAIQQHEQETQQQVQNLEMCFNALGVKPMKVKCAAVQGLIQEREDFLKEKPTPELIGMFDLGAAAKTEHYEMAAYRGLVEQARMMGQQECARLLQQNLQQEEQMAQRVEQIARQVGQRMTQMMGTQPGHVAQQQP